MTTQATAEVFWLAFRALRNEERQAVVERFLRDEEFREELIDTVIIQQRQDEDLRPLAEYLVERNHAA